MTSAYIARLVGLPGALAVTAAVLTGCGNFPVSTTSAVLACDDTMKTAFKPDANTTVLLAKAFVKGEPLALSGTPATPAPPVVAADMCLVKLLIGPGNRDKEGAPSNTKGIGIEVWLPAKPSWNERIRAYGSGGWTGGRHTDATRLGWENVSTQAHHRAATAMGYVVVVSDHGKTSRPYTGGGSDGSFLMNADGSINQVSWQDYSERSMHEMAVKSKALAAAYYGRPAKFTYWDGFSTGGRQGMKNAQKFPEDYNGILAGAPAINFTKLSVAGMYPHTVMLRDVGVPIATAKLMAASAAATRACDPQGFGFPLDPRACRYDPTRDAKLLCPGVSGSGGAIGANAGAACLSLAEATAINKIWYGQTSDGSVPDPSIDNASSAQLGSKQLWWGIARGATLTDVAGAVPGFADNVALVLQSPAYALATRPSFVHASIQPADKWKELSYADLANVQQRGQALQPQFSDINTDSVNLADFRNKGGKMMVYHGLADEVLPAQGSINYFARLESAMGGSAKVQEFARLYLIPGMGHSSTFKVSTIDPATNAITAANKVPLPALVTKGGTDQMFLALREWVENGKAPGRLDIASANGSVTMPICVYPLKATYSGTGSLTATASYNCK